jgi:hypothetical protein
VIQEWKEIPVGACETSEAKKMALRLNSLGSLYFFSKYVLLHDRLSPNLHRYLCS